MLDYYYILDNIIKQELDQGQTIAIYPFGKVGLQAKNIMTDRYGHTGILIDNHLSQYNHAIIDLDKYMELDNPGITIIVCSSDIVLNKELGRGLKERNVTARIKNIMVKPLEQCPEKGEYFEQVKKLCQVKKAVGYELVRAGKKNDGGYIMLDDFKNSGAAYSFGIGSDISWDEWMAEKGIKVHCYDHTIAQLPKENRRLFFHKIGIAGMDCMEENLLSLESILLNSKNKGEKNLILKMDVEGAEWETINNVSSQTLRQFSQMTFELHELTDIQKSREIITALEKINKTHQVVWIHANNGGGAEQAGNIIVPRLLEITYASREQYEFETVEYNCPLDIDEPNVVDYCDIELKGWGMAVDRVGNSVGD